MEWHFTFSGPVTITGLSDSQFHELLAASQTIDGKVGRLLMDEQLVKDALAKIDATTTKAASNIQILANTDQAISDEFDALVQALKDAKANGTGVTQGLIDSAQASADRSQSVSDQLDAMVPALQSIASKGVSNPVPVEPPVVVPPPPPVPVVG